MIVRLFAVLAVLVGVGSLRADDYMIVFSAEKVPYRPTGAHTFAALVQIEPGPDGNLTVVACDSLSWLPASGKIRGLALKPEPGRNVPLNETLDDAVVERRQICVWGPYLVKPELAEMFRARVTRVESSFRYKAASFLSPLDVCDCTRSIEEMVGPRRYIGVYGYGAAASSVVVQRCSPWFVKPDCTHPDVIQLLGLDSYPLVYRRYGDYTTRFDQLKASVRHP